jgi:hypothetical protein
VTRADSAQAANRRLAQRAADRRLAPTRACRAAQSPRSPRRTCSSRPSVWTAPPSACAFSTPSRWR